MTSINMSKTSTSTPENKLRVLHILETLNPYGGTPQKIKFQAANSKNVKYSIYCTGQIGELASDIKMYGVNVYGGYDGIWLLPLDVIKILKIIKQDKINIVHLHFARSRLVGLILKLLTRVPLITSEHGAVPETRKFVRWVDALLFSTNTPIIFNSNASRSEFQKRCRAKRNYVVYNGVPDPFQSSAKREAINTTVGLESNGNQPINLIAVGGFIWWRRYATLISSLIKVKSNGLDFHLTIFGDGPLRSEIELQIKSSDLSSCVTLKGYGQRNEVLDSLKVSDMLINCATHEGFGIAVVEAMLACKPVILARAGSLLELLPTTDDVQYFEAGNIDELSLLIDKLAKDAELRAILGSRNRNHAERAFGVSRFVDQIESIYNECLSANH